jgi:hypothetical protein
MAWIEELAFGSETDMVGSGRTLFVSIETGRGY